jgi:hypothetical protein
VASADVDDEESCCMMFFALMIRRHVGVEKKFSAKRVVVSIRYSSFFYSSFFSY